MPTEPDITGLLNAARSGQKVDLDRLFQAVYGQLRAIAHKRRQTWQGNDTLNTTALVHEAYLKLNSGDGLPGQDRGQFFAAAANAMRQILVDYARMRNAAKRGTGRPEVALEDNPVASDEAAEGLLAVDQALTQLSQAHPRQCRVVECRFFAGLDVPDTAQALNVSEATVKRDWARALTWMHRKLELANGV